jgi:serine/threonine protein kinase
MRDNADHEPEEPDQPEETVGLRPQADVGTPRKVPASPQKIAWAQLGFSERSPPRGGVGTVPGSPRKIDRYELCEMIGCGGMGAVYRAVDTKLGRTVALKTAAAPQNGARLTDRVRQRFLREAMALSKVEHRNVVQVLDFGFADDGTPFLVMEHLRGRDLGALLAQSERPLPVTDVVDIMLAVCAALRACHRAGIIHRDLKPGNIFLAETETGPEVKVLDFGVSKAPTADDLTREGQILGTPQYLAPEQIDGKVGPASDQYALGVVLYVCLTLRLPYEDHQNRQLLRAIETGTFESPRTFRSDLPEALEAIVLRAMHVSPSERFESVYALGQRLWELASPRSQEEWRSYYLPRAAGGRKAVGGIVAKTQILEDSRAADSDSESGTSFGSPTKAAPSSAPVELSSWDESSALEQQSWEDLLRSGSRRQMAAAALALLALGGVFAARLRASHRRAFVAQTTPIGPRAAPVAPPTARVGPRNAPVVRTVSPIRPASSPEPAPVTAAVLSHDRSTFPAPPLLAPARPHRTPRGKRAPFERALPNIDQAGIGIPSE